MALPNNDPIYTRVGAMSSVVLSAANTKSDGTGTIGTDIFIAATVDATNGGFVRDVTFYPTSSVANTAMTTNSIGRVFFSSATSGATSTTNTHPQGETLLTAVTASSSTVSNAPIVFPLNKPVPPGWTILVTTHATTAANTAWRAVVTFGAY